MTIMTSINPANLISQYQSKPKKVSSEKKEEIRDGVVTGGAVGAGYTAVRKNALNMIKETESACKAGKAAAAARAANAAKGGAGLFAGLKNNAKVITKNLITKLDAIKTSKYIKPIINNKLTRAACGAFGGFLAVCILISGIGTLYNNSIKMANHYIPRYADRFNRLSDRFDKGNKD